MPADPNYNQSVCLRDNFTMYPVQRTFFSNALYGNDQLRQRVAFALHQILVVSGNSEVNRPSWMTPYLQALDRNAFGNYQTLLNEITLTPAMGEYLDMRLSTRTSPTRILRAKYCSSSRSAPTAQPRRYTAARCARQPDPDLHADGR